MGLDMNLYRKRYVKNWDYDKATKYEVTLKVNGEAVKLTQPSYIVEELAYWRKANAIHNWFVQNCNNGHDNNGSMGVDYTDLVELQSLVNQVLDSIKLAPGKVANGYTYSKTGEKQPIWEDGQTVVDPGLAAELLPCTKGFFFGSTDYDEYYVEDLKHTKEVLDNTLSDPDEAKQHEYEYVASW